MRLDFHRRFRKSYRKRIVSNPKIVSQFARRLALLLKDPSHPLLNDHALIGEKSDFRAFSVSGDIRVVYQRIDGTVRLYDIGTHNQVY